MAKKKSAKTKKVERGKKEKKINGFKYVGTGKITVTSSSICTGDILVSIVKKFVNITSDPSKDEPIINRITTEEEILNSEILKVVAMDKNKETENSEFIYSADYSSVSLNKKQHTLTKNQSEVIKMLHNAKSEAPYLRQTSILKQINSFAPTLEKVFQQNKKAYKDLIVADGKKGLVRLNIDSKK